MDVCFIQDDSSIYYKHSLYWQDHIFIFILKIYERIETGGSDKGLPNYKVEEDQMY